MAPVQLSGGGRGGDIDDHTRGKVMVVSGPAVAASVYRQIGVQIAASGHGWHQGRQVTGLGTKILCSLRASGSLWRRLWWRPAHQKALHDVLRGLPYVG